MTKQQKHKYTHEESKKDKETHEESKKESKHRQDETKKKDKYTHDETKKEQKYKQEETKKDQKYKQAAPETSPSTPLSDVTTSQISPSPLLTTLQAEEFTWYSTPFTNSSIIPLKDRTVPLWLVIFVGCVGAVFLIACITCAIITCRRSKRKRDDRRALHHDFPDKDFEVEKVQTDHHGPKNKVGQLSSAIQYDHTTRKLHITVIECKDLPKVDITNDPYVKVYLSPQMKPSYVTKHKSNTLNPKYNESFSFDIGYENLIGTAAVFLVYDYNIVEKNTKMAELRVDLEQVDWNHLGEVWRDLGPPQDDEKAANVGQICISVRYIPVTKQLKVVVIEAKKIQASTSEVYIKLAIMQGTKRLAKKKTSRKKGTADPYFNEIFTFIVPPELMQTISLVITLAEHDTLGRMVFIGKIELGGGGLPSEQAHWSKVLANVGRPIALWHTLHE